MYVKNMKKPVLTTFFLVLTVLLQGCSNPSEPNIPLGNKSNFGNYTSIGWVGTDLIYDSSASKNSLSILYFTDDACPDGVLMEANTFVDSAVIMTLNNSYNTARISTANDSLIQFKDLLMTGNELFKLYNLVGVPSILVLDSDNRYFKRIQADYYPPDSFLVLLQSFIAQSQ